MRDAGLETIFDLAHARVDTIMMIVWPKAAFFEQNRFLGGWMVANNEVLLVEHSGGGGLRDSARIQRHWQAPPLGGT